MAEIVADGHGITVSRPTAQLITRKVNPMDVQVGDVIVGVDYTPFYSRATGRTLERAEFIIKRWEI